MADQVENRKLLIFSRIFQGLPESVIIEDMNGMILEINSETEKLLGWSCEELSGRSVKSLVPACRRNETDELLPCCPLGGVVRNAETLLENRQGEIITVLLSRSLITDKNGGPLAVASVIRDISRKKEAELELRHISRVFRSILDNVPVYVNSIDDKGIIISSMGSVGPLQGVEQDELKGSHISEYFRHAGSVMKRVMNGETITSLENFEYGGRQWFFQNTFFPGGKNGEGILNIGIDVTELRNLQKTVINISEMERENMARELHDELGQLLTGIAYLVKALEDKKRESNSVDISDIETISGLIGRALNQTRNLSRGFSRVQLNSDFGIAMEELISETEKVYGITCNISREGAFTIDDSNTASHLYYIVREALHNAVKHRASGVIDFSMKSGGDSIRFDISNIRKTESGAGEDRSGLGMKIMKYRADIIGADLFSGFNGDIYTVTIIKEKIFQGN